MHPAPALLGAALALQGMPPPPAAVDAGGLRGAQVHRVVVGWAPVLAAAVGTEAATQGQDRWCHLREMSQPWCTSPGTSAEVRNEEELFHLTRGRVKNSSKSLGERDSPLGRCFVAAGKGLLVPHPALASLTWALALARPLQFPPASP